jgi:hypothetical protein
MKATRAALLAASLVFVSGAPVGAGETTTAPTSLALGAKAPMATTRMKTANGKEVSIADVKGAKGTLVVFTCNACPWAKKWESRIVELGNDAGKKGIGMIAINSNDPNVNADDSYASCRRAPRSAA